MREVEYLRLGPGHRVVRRTSFGCDQFPPVIERVVDKGKKRAVNGRDEDPVWPGDYGLEGCNGGYPPPGALFGFVGLCGLRSASVTVSVALCISGPLQMGMVTGQFAEHCFYPGK